MSITTDSYIEVRDNSLVLLDKIGLSKTLDNYSIDEITSYCYCGADNNLIRYPYMKSDIQAFLNDIDIPFHIENTPNNYFTFTLGDRTPYADISGIYGRVVWLSDTVNTGADVITSDNATNFKLVTEFKANHYCYEWTNPHTVNVGSYSYGTTNWNGSDMTAHKIWAASGGGLKYYKDFVGGDIIDVSANHIKPFFLCEINGKMYCFALSLDINHYKSNYNMYTLDANYPPQTGYSYSSWDKSESFDVCYTAVQTWDATFSNTSWNFPYTYNRFSAGVYGYPTILQGFDDDKVTGLGIVGGTTYDLDCGWEFNYYFKERDDVYKLLSGCGVYFKTDKIYKPIISGGYVTGYTDNLTTQSDIDTWQGSTNHNIPPSPSPTPTGDNENKEIEMPLAYIGGTGGFVQFIKINSAGLASADDISAALSRFDITTIGKDLLRNFVSYKCFAILSIDPNDTVTRQIKVDGHALTDENDQPLNGQIIGSVLPIDFEIGTPSRYFNDFRDFAPYTKIEAYVPFCGWFSLPSWCIGHKITGTMFTDLYNGTVKAVIFAGSTVVAEIGGCCAYDIPFVADATGAKAGAVISSALSTAAATAATVSMPNVATGIAAVTSAANTISSVNSNVTTLKGVLGDGSNLNGLLHCYLKITRPQSPTRNNVIPDTYKHEIGIPTYKELTLAAGDGYTQILDANITGAMTDREKQMIIDGFRHGLIL